MNKSIIHISRESRFNDGLKCNNSILKSDTTNFSKSSMLAEQCIIDILKNDLMLDDEHIWSGLISRKFPVDSDDLFITVDLPKEFMPVFPIPNQLCISNGEENNRFYCRALVQIDLISRSIISERTRMQVIKALNSSYAATIQEKYPFRIINIPDQYINTTGLMGKSFNRFTITIRVISAMDISMPEISTLHKEFIESNQVLIPDKYFKNLDELVRYVEINKFNLFLSEFCYLDYTGNCILEKDGPYNTFYETVVEELLKITEYTPILEIYDANKPDKKIGNWAILAHKKYVDTYSTQKIKKIREQL